MKEYTNISNKLRKELESIREDEPGVTLAQLLTFKSHVSGWKNWLDVAECEKSTERNLLVIVRNIKNIEMKDFDDNIIILVNTILRHEKVTDKISNELAQNIPFLNLKELDWAKAGEETLVSLCRRVNSFPMYYLENEYKDFVDKLCSHPNATMSVWQMFEDSEVESFKEIAIKCIKCIKK